MVFEEFYKQVMGMNAVSFYDKTARAFLTKAERLSLIPADSMSFQTISKIRDGHERAHNYANTPIVALELLKAEGKKHYTVRDHALIGNNGLGVLVLQTIYEGMRELKISTDAILN